MTRIQLIDSASKAAKILDRQDSALVDQKSGESDLARLLAVSKINLIQVI